MRIFSLTIIVLALLAIPAAAAEEADLFRDQVAPIFERQCVGCHNDETRKGELSLQSAAAALRGGESGVMIVPGDTGASVLLEYVSGDDPEMPQDAEPLSGDEVAALRRWIAAGAKWPEAMRLKDRGLADRNWWSLKPVARPEIPRLSEADARVARGPIDAFVIAKLRQQRLQLSPPADRRTLIRRLYYDLTGLPPTPKSVQRFINDDDPRAYEKLVDHLLESPHYGERWARHWLDVVHYGETHGYDKDKLRMNAWPYRDYVIRAFNQDKPYSRFVREQIAGDVLWPHTTDGITATGFIAAGPWDFIGHAEVPETKIDGKVARNLDRDNMVTSTMNSFCSLTVQCARCHNHKLDPVTMENYYSLQAVFAAMDRADRPYDVDSSVGEQRQRLLQRKNLLDQQSAELAKAIDAKKTPEIRELEKTIAALEKKRSGAVVAASVPRSSAMGYHSQVAPAADAVKWVQVDLGRQMPVDDVLLFGADEYGWGDFGFPHRFRIELFADESFSNPVSVADFTKKDFARPGARAAHFPAGGSTGRFVRVTATRLWSRRRKEQPPSNDWIFALGELAVFSGGQLVSPQAVSAADSIEASGRWSRANLIDGVYGTHNLEELTGRKDGSPTNGYHSQFAPTGETTKWIQIDLGQAAAIDRIRLVPAFPTDWKDTPGFGFPVRFKLEIAEDAEFTKPQMVADFSQTDFANPGGRVVSYAVGRLKARFVRLTANRLWDRGERSFALALAEIEVESGGRNLARDCTVTATDSINAGRWHTKNLVDGFTSRRPTEVGTEELLAFAAPSTAVGEIAVARAEHDALIKQAIGSELLRQQDENRQALARTDASLAALPKPSVVYAGTVHNGRGAFRGRYGLAPREIHILNRGNVTQPDKLVGPAAVPFIEGVPAKFNLPPKHDEGQRRVALANWITHKDNPLTWRSIVNRIWLYHFGQGIVDSPNDFGRGGQMPTHPELLDWLAVEFRDGSQSIKELHRKICNSTVYRQSSAHNEQFAKIDKENKYLWRMTRRRLAAEEIRDSVLVVAGKLDTKMGGTGYMDFIIEHPEHSPHYEYHKYDPQDVKTHRRAVYRFIVRSQPQPFMNTLDCADPSMSVPKRDETLTALQALTLLNNRFMVAMSENFAKRLSAERGDLSEQIALAFQLTTSRSATADELSSLTRYAQQFGLPSACRIILNLNEFVFVD